MPNIYWYYGLIVIGAVITVYTVYKKRSIADLFSYFLFVTAWSWIGEAVILFLLNGYAYKPGLYSDPFAENILGHIIANSALWSSTAICVMYFQLSYRWIGLISIVFMLIEVVFLKVGVYNHHWWHTYMTGIVTFIFMAAMKKWYSIVNRKRHKSPRIIIFWTIAWIILQTPTSILMLLGKQFFHVNWVENIYRDSTLFSGFLYHVLMAVIVIFFIYIPKKGYWRVVPFFVLLLGDVFLMNMKILVFHDDWKLSYLICIRAASLLFIMLIEKFTLRRVKVENVT
ncbi:hypothetical protein FB550_1072 [Neobacillus bataviensis]|uniref:Uncharacterized protein n=1 Tax=Neobacillus bataviensis TaxID=220685 RepID=A0A561D7X5_9BACI|nr:hypothetical protein [Neobacillus bataviensis]TWD99367.1 hypothetical protein FB550_1072 [Neobacillus bataviensis]